MTARPRVVAIDGAAGSGKSTLARALARALGLAYINTGLMYRALAATAMDAHVSPDDQDALVNLTRELTVTIEGADPSELRVEGYPREVLAAVEVEAIVSAVARHPGVRALMRAAQRELGTRGGAVMEGRDIGSVVFADAPVKLYLSAGEDERALRRADERRADLGPTERALAERDRLDAETTPHVPADGAVIIDTTDLDVGRTLERALAVVARLAPELVA